MTHPFRFGVQATNASTRSAWTEFSRRVESLGYDVLTMPDHFDEQLAPGPALMAAAAVTDRLRIGALVWDNDYRHPVVLAKELATMDVLSDGRLEIGLGAGWLVKDYEQAGMPYDRPGVRIERMVEGIEVMTALFADGPVDYAGTHYRITGLEGTPKPVQRPRPPILIGGGGPKMLQVCAAHADIVGINGTMVNGVVDAAAIATMTAEAVQDKVATLRSHAGDRFESIELNVRAFMVSVTDDAAGTIDGVAAMLGVEASMVAETPYALVGSVDKIVEDLLARREQYGFSYVIVGAAEVDAFAPVVARLAGK